MYDSNWYKVVTVKRDFQFLKFSNPFTTLYWYRIENWLIAARYFVVQCDPLILDKSMFNAALRYAWRVILHR